ncbi:patched domain-containing protein 3-like [Glandiceps talaboti]
MVAFDCIEKRLRQLLKVYGEIVGHHFVPFIFIPVMMTAGLALGSLYFEQNTDTEYLFSPVDGPARKNRAEIEKYFAMDFDDGFTRIRQTDRGRYAYALVTAKDGGDILRKCMIEEILKFDGQVKRLVVRHWGQYHDYDTLCGKWKGKCAASNAVLKLMNYNSSYMDMLNEYSLSYPVIAVGYFEYFIGGSLGGVEYLNNTDIIKSAKAMSLLYSLRSDELDDVSGKWEDKFVDMTLEYESDEIDISFIVSRSLDNDYVAIVISMLPRTIPPLVLVSVFSLCACMMADWVTSKPILAIMGVISALLAVVSAFGLLLLCGVPFIHLVICMLFLILGVGVDDMFIMIASWRTTSPRLSVAERLGETFSEAALSITITSLTDALAFGVGAISNIPSVRIFCCYCGVAIVFDYLYQITFFGGCMALIGHREKQNRHCITMKTVVSKVESPSKVYNIFCAGGYARNTPGTCHETPKEEHTISQFLEKYYGPFITKFWVKVVIGLLYLSYISLALWGCLKVSIGMDLQKLTQDNSYSIKYYDLENKYFVNYGAVVQFVITTPQNYSDPALQTQIKDVVHKIQESEWFHNDGKYTTQCWLLDYLSFLNRTGLTYHDEESFISLLRDKFLSLSIFEQYTLDIAFDSNFQTIESSRVLATSRVVLSSTAATKANTFHNSRSIAKESSIPMIAYNPSFIFDDTFDEIVPVLTQNLTLAIGGILIISLLLIPHPICSVYVVVSVASTTLGIIGYMALWDIGLDPLAMVNIIISIGFSIDHSVHFIYTFTISPRGSSNDRIIWSLRVIGVPILQSVFSTCLAIVPLYASNIYVYRAVFVTLFLGITFGCLHGLLFLPVLLSLIGPGKSTEQQDMVDRNVYDKVYLG